MPTNCPGKQVENDKGNNLHGIKPNDKWNNDDEVVISGLSGRFPESASVEEFKQQLFDGVDLVTDDERRWPSGIYGLPSRTGKLKNLEHFDAKFFGVHDKQAKVMDPQLRIMLELTHEAIIDAGVNPMELRGSRTGVFVGVSLSESVEIWSSDPDKINGYELTGCCTAMFANRISYTFDFNGPSFAINSACSSSLYTLKQAVEAMKSGQCDAAIVGSSNLILRPTSSLQYNRLTMLNPQGSCNAFDESAKGFVRSEAVVILYLQKYSVAKRIYATVIGAKTNTDGYKEKGITFPSGKMQSKLIRELYEEVGVDPVEVAYFEAHGTGTKAGDNQEVNSIADVFCKDRKEALLIGSVKSNMGHSEPAAGLCSIVKVVIGMETGIMPGNLHFKNPNPNIPALFDGRLKVVAKNQPWNGGYVGINSFGFGGANAHVLLKSNPKRKVNVTVETVPRIFTVSGRTPKAVHAFLDKLEKNPNDNELMTLIHDIHKQNISGHGYRGYNIVGDKPMREVIEVTTVKRPVWFVFSGMGSQWGGMGKDLMHLDSFKNAINNCCYALKPHGINLEDIIMNSDGSAFDNILNSFVGIAAVQIALTDVLASLGIYPDGIVGHSVGEVLCAYADGSFTAEQTILGSFFRGKSVVETKLPLGSMAAIGLSLEDCERRCPPEIYSACHNCKDNVTISGPPQSIQKFVEELSAENIFAKSIKSSGYAFHSKYTTDCSSKLRKALDAIIPNPKPRTSRWISSSIPESEWNTPIAQLNSAAYHVNNFISPVLFHEAVQHIPENAIVIEIAPHCILKAILKRSLGSNTTYIGLMDRGHENNLQLFMTNMGKLYNSGVHPKFAKLYQPISYPVGRGTPMIQSMLEWNHSTEWAVANFTEEGVRSGKMVVEIDLSQENDQYLSGHALDGSVLFPATGYLILVWRTFAKLRNEDYKKLPVIFENVQFLRATILPKIGPIKFLISFLRGIGDFEICENGSVVVSGRIFVPEDVSKEMLDLPKPFINQEENVMTLNSTDIYKELSLRGYDYRGIFKGIHKSNNRGNYGLLKWENNWISFMDTMLQFSILGQTVGKLYVPRRLERATLNPTQLLEYLADLQEKGASTYVPVHTYRNFGVIKTAGIEFRGIKFNIATRNQQAQSVPKLEKYIYVPYENNNTLAEDYNKARVQSLTVLLQTLIENNKEVLKLKVSEISEDSPKALLAPIIVQIIESEPKLSVEYTVVTATDAEVYKAAVESIGGNVIQKNVSQYVIDQNNHLIIAKGLLSQNKFDILDNVVNYLKQGGMIILEESAGVGITAALTKSGIVLVSRQSAGTKSYLMLKKSAEIVLDSIVLQITEKNLNWVEPLKEALKKSETEDTKIYIVVQNEELSGIMGLTTCITQEPGGQNVRSVFIQDKKSEKFSLNTPFFVKQLEKDLVFNVLKNGSWGSFRHILLDNEKNTETLQVEHAYINALTRNDMSSLKWIEGPLSYYKYDNPNAELCHVYYCPINFRDVMLVSGKMSQDYGDRDIMDCCLGVEFSGRDSKGHRVMGMVPAGGFATTVLTDSSLLWKVPENWSLEEASTVPIAYGTSYYALVVRGRMKSGESILIHAGAGGVGQAAISISLHMGCTVFTTVGSQEKRDFIKQRFPQITDRNIGNSRDTSFEQLILQETNGKGVDIVLNSLSEEKLQATVKCMAKFGRFLEIGKVDCLNNNSLGMAIFLKNTTFHGIYLDDLFHSDNVEMKETFRLITEGIKNGAVKPLPTTIFSETQAEQAFRFMANGKHIGKVVLKIRDEENNNTQKPTTKLVSAIPRSYMDQDKSYVLVGGLGGFGLELANWLITRGASKIVLTSQSGIKTGYQSLCIRRWQEKGVKIVISTTDITNETGAICLLKESNNLGPVGGIFNLTIILRDAIMENQTESDFIAVCRPKIDITKNLDVVSRAMCPHLDYFIIFSSVISGRGIAGQVNYGYANSAVERICEARQAAGLPGLAIQWGLIGDVGHMLNRNVTEIAGTLPQKIASCLQIIDNFMKQPHPVLSSMVVARKYKTNTDSNTVSLTVTIANILGIIDTKTIQPNVSLAQMGLDSIMEAEIKQTLTRNFNLVFNAKEIRALTFARLAEFNTETLVTPTLACEFLQKQSVGDWKEIMSSKSIIKMKSKVTNLQAAALFIIHPIEGVVNALEELIKEIKYPVYSLKCTAQAPLTSINALAKFYIEQIRSVQSKGPYTICGYSFGTCVAFEMAVQLENVKERVYLILLDGSPSYVITQLGKLKDTNGVIHNGALTFFIKQFKIINQSQMMKEFLTIKSWDEKLTKTAKVLCGVTPFSANQLKMAATSFINQLLAADKYKPSDKFNGEVVLIRAKDSCIQLEDDYGLNSCCEQKVTVESLDGNHRSMLRGSTANKIVNIIHAYLDKD